MVRRLLSFFALSVALVVLLPGAALACGGLIAPGHAEVLRRATTLAAWHGGYEHYVTGFQFAGSAHSFGYIIPLPAEPANIQKGGEWTLERLQLEVSPRPELAFAGASLADAALAGRVTVLQQVRVEALDITVVRGGGRDVAAWAEEHGFDLTSDTPEVLGRYSSSGAIFALAKFDNREAARRGFVEGQGTVIHFTIPTEAPWVPLQILGLGKSAVEPIDADLFILTDTRPDLSPRLSGISGWEYTHDAEASQSLLADLRSDKGMRWLPTTGMWLTGLTVSTPAWTMNYDLSIDGGGPVEGVHAATIQGLDTVAWPVWIAFAALGVLLVGMIRWNRPSPLRPA